MMKSVDSISTEKISQEKDDTTVYKRSQEYYDWRRKAHYVCRRQKRKYENEDVERRKENIERKQQEALRETEEK